MSEVADRPELVRGLEGIPCATSSISSIDGQAGELFYRGYTIEDLAEQCSFEEVAYLLLHGELPTRDQLESFDGELRAERGLADGLIAMIRTLPADGHPMDVLQASVAAMGAFYASGDVNDPSAQRKAVIRLLAKLPTVVAVFDRNRRGEALVAPRDDLGHGANFLYMLSGQEPDPVSARTMDVALLLHAEHTMNASTFAARAVSSTLADPYAVISAAIGSLSGPLHGGANERVLGLLAEIGSVDAVERVVGGKLDRKEKVMGIGHRVYKTKDPRAKVLQGLAAQLFDKLGADVRYDIAMATEAYTTERLGAKGIYPNVDFYSGIVYARMGIEKDLYTPIFAIARVAGWLAHWLSQLDGNRIYRPTQIYEGYAPRPVVPMNQRG